MNLLLLLVRRTSRTVRVLFVLLSLFLAWALLWPVLRRIHWNAETDSQPFFAAVNAVLPPLWVVMSVWLGPRAFIRTFKR